MIQFSKSSIKRKVTTVIMRASVAVLLVTVAAFMIYDLAAFRQTMVQNLVTQARTIAENSTGALAFKNEGDAAKVLDSLRTDPHIIAAATYDAQGKLFAKYPASIPDAGLPDKSQNQNYKFGKSSLTVLQPVIQSGTQLGVLFLRSDLTALSQRFKIYAAISSIITVGALLVAFVFSSTLQRRISNPIIALAEVAMKISRQSDYSLRAPKLSDDEIGLLTDSFNTMLGRIQEGEAALRTENAERRQVEEWLKKSLKDVGDLQAALDEHAIVAVTDPQGKITYVNDKFCAISKYSREELLGQDHRIINSAYHSKIFIRDLWMTIGRGEVWKGEIQNRAKDGSYYWVDTTIVPFLNEDGKPRQYVAIRADITERKREEQELQRARDEALNASRAKDDFLAALSHELRTPLNPVLLVASDAAADPQLPDKTRADFEMIRRNVELEARLIDDLLDLTRITRGKLPLEKRPLDVRAVLEDTVEIIKAEAEAKQIGLAVDFGAEQNMVLGDAVRLQQIFWNVLKNAVKFTPEGGRITVETRTLAESGNIAITITDTGIGMTAGEIGHIFNAFSQGDHAGGSASHRFGGLGLGLAISQMLAELHSGVIRAASAGREQGATFTIELPCVRVEKEKNNFAPPKQPLVNNSHAASKNKPGRRILLVEDHEPTRTALAHLLTRRNYKVMTATSVAEARALARREKFDLVVSDIGLPDGNGYALMSGLRDDFGLKGIALTGYGMEQDVLRGQNAGFVAHLIKPVRMESLEKLLGETI